MNIHTGFTPAVVQAVSLNLKLPSESWMQDWPLEVEDSGRVGEFLHALENETDPDQQEAIAALLVASLDSAFQQGLIYPNEFLRRVGNNIAQRDELMDYWSQPEAETAEEMFTITPWIRALRSNQAIRQNG